MQQQLKHSRLLQSGATSTVTPFNRFISGDMQLSEHFTLSEMCFSQTAAQHKPPVPNIPLKCHITALQNLAQRALEPIRQHLGLPIKVNSGYRCMMVNTMVGGAPTSQHTRGEAADITIVRSARPFAHATDEQAARLVFSYARQYADFDQLILEHHGTSWWVHISCKVDYRRNRRQTLNIEH